MSIKIHNYAGHFGWNMRKYFPKLASTGYLSYQFITRRASTKKYIDYFMSGDILPHPLVVNLETMNRCNNTCGFCTANKNAEKRPFMKMSDDLFKSVIDQLRDWNYKGYVCLYGNNEPLLDVRIIKMHKYVRDQLPDSYLFLSTNGILLNIEKLNALCLYIDKFIINNYSMDMKLYDNIQEIYEYVKANEEKFRGVNIKIQMRYLHEVLTNRAGSAPNKAATKKVIKEPCLLPYTDMWITPDGRLLICCCDNLEVTELANLNDTPLAEAWDSDAYKDLRRNVRIGRQNYPFCRHCDFIDAGMRRDIVDPILKEKNL